MVRKNATDNSERTLLSDVEQHGWHIIGVNSDESGPGFVYSVGLFQTTGHPEVCMFGCDNAADAFSIINQIGHLVKSGNQFCDGTQSDDVFDECRSVFRSVLPENYVPYFGYAKWYYESWNFPMIQCFWPDKNGFFPWQDDFSIELLDEQPQLWKSA